MRPSRLLATALITPLLAASLEPLAWGEIPRSGEGIVDPAPAPEAAPELPVAIDRPGDRSPRYALPLLGAYRKTMEIEAQIQRACDTYGVPLPLARAVCMYESGGDDQLISGAGARGYFQVMPRTFRLMRVSTNIEAGVKYLASLLRQFGREDDALAAYNGGPGRVSKGRPMPIESLQYVVGVGIYRTLLTHEEPQIRGEAGEIGLYRVTAGETWDAVAERHTTPLTVLRLLNPYLATRALRQGSLVAFPLAPLAGILENGSSDPSPGSKYTTRRGDNYLLLAFGFDIDLEQFRRDNSLWRVQPPFEGMRLVLTPRARGPGSPPPAAAGEAGEPGPVVASGPPADAIGEPAGAAVSGSAGNAGEPGSLSAARLTGGTDSGRPKHVVHKVRRGETLQRIASRYGVSIASIRKANNLRHSRLIVGQILRIPVA